MIGQMDGKRDRMTEKQTLKEKRTDRQTVRQKVGKIYFTSEYDQFILFFMRAEKSNTVQYTF